jgi:thioesterase domain-containing protein
MTPAELEAYLRDAMPLSAAMGVHVVEAGPERVRIEAPLQPNLNHRLTAFGGSVAALAILTGWALVHTRLRHEGVHARTVIQRSTLDYVAPIESAFTAVCDAPDPAAWARFVRTLERRGRGRIGIHARVEVGGHAAASFQGAYVAMLGTDSPRPPAGAARGPSPR